MLGTNKKFIKGLSTCLVALCAMQFSAITPVKSTKAATVPNITYTTVGDTKTVGSTFDLVINTSSVTNFYGASIDLKLDPTLVQVVPQNSQTFAVGNVLGTAKQVNPVNKYANDTASVAFSLQGNVAGVTTPSTGTLATIKLKVLKAGSITLNTVQTNSDLTATGNNVRVKLSDANSAPINYTSTATPIQIGPSTPVVDASKINTFTVDKANLTLGSTAVFTATATPSDKTLYQFYASKDGGAWARVQAFSTKNTLSFTPTQAAKYAIKVEVKHVNSTKAFDDSRTIENYVVSNQVVTTPAKITSFTSDKPSGQLAGTRITFNATATPENAGVKYQYYLKKDNGPWMLCVDYTEKSVCAWTPKVPGTYYIRVRVKNPNSTNTGSADDYRDMSFVIK